MLDRFVLGLAITFGIWAVGLVLVAGSVSFYYYFTHLAW